MRPAVSLLLCLASLPGFVSAQAADARLCLDPTTAETIYFEPAGPFTFRFPMGFAVQPAAVAFPAMRAAKESVVFLVGVSDVAATTDLASLRSTLPSTQRATSDAMLRQRLRLAYDSTATPAQYTQLQVQPLRAFPHLEILREEMTRLAGHPAHRIEAFFTDTTTRRSVRHLGYVLLSGGRLFVIKVTATIYDFQDMDALIRHSFTTFAFAQSSPCPV